MQIWLTHLKMINAANDRAEIRFLASGEYNSNFLVSEGENQIVLRINHGSQLGLKAQIQYEFNVLSALKNSGVTPIPLQLLPPSPVFPAGALTMSFIPGRPFKYEDDTPKAARLFALLHDMEIKDQHHFVKQPDPVSAIINESRSLLNRHPQNPLTENRARLEKQADYLQKYISTHGNIFENEPQVLANTEVNSGNFIVDHEKARLVDWEKAVISTAFQDLAHFIVPTTTLWKSAFTADKKQRISFLKQYVSHRAKNPGFNVKDAEEKLKLMENTILLRGLSWCCMAHYEYTSGIKEIRNEQTLRTIKKFMDDIEWFLN